MNKNALGIVARCIEFLAAQRDQIDPGKSIVSEDLATAVDRELKFAIQRLATLRHDWGWLADTEEKE